MSFEFAFLNLLLFHIKPTIRMTAATCVGLYSNCIIVKGSRRVFTSDSNPINKHFLSLRFPSTTNSKMNVRIYSAPLICNSTLLNSFLHSKISSNLHLFSVSCYRSRIYTSHNIRAGIRRYISHNAQRLKTNQFCRNCTSLELYLIKL